jgi:hypothetical protein
VIFSLSLPFALFVFTLWYLNTFWVHVMHILDDILWAFGECNMEKNSNPKAEPHGSLQSCTVRPRKGTRQCSIGWVGGYLASKHNGDHSFKKIKCTLCMGSHVNIASQTFHINRILKKGRVIGPTTN